ncbi:laminin subunit beta-3 [Menidia menidia]
MRIILLLTVIWAACRAQSGCPRGACFPPINDLLLGRAQRLQASSTCGLTGSEVYCTPYQQRRMKCCPCDSRNPDSRLAHTVKDVLSSSGPDRWWQSRKELSPVTLQLDLNNLFQLHNLVLSFKGPRPSAFVIEKTLDNGRTWQPALYLAAECGRAFPGIPTAAPLTLDQTYCHALPPVGNNPYQDHTIQFSPLRQYAFVPAPDSKKIEDVAGLTGLRVRLTELGDVPRLPGRSLSRFFALKEMRVYGSCMCHGHADRCLPEEPNNQLSYNMAVHPRCDCQHNTAGLNCERCADLYNDLPWRPAEEGNTHACKRCECNNHAQRCRFDWGAFEASGRRSGGVCEGCLHHTTGPRCDQCLPGYQPNPRSRMDRPDACIRCSCSAEGALDGGRCEDSSGSCRCKENVEGPRCDRCKRGFYGLSAANPLGCSKCPCSPAGSLSDTCDPDTGACSCRAHFHGPACDRCSGGYWRPPASDRCEACGCDPTRSNSDSCDQLTGQCDCRPGFGGKTCTECPENTYGDPLIGCRPCRCEAEGTLRQGCDQQTGVCLCRPGVAGSRCDSCAFGHCDSFPDCQRCPSCFFTLDLQRKNLSVALDRLSSKLVLRPSGAGAKEFEARLRVLETNLNLVRNSISLPPGVVTQVDEALINVNDLRKKVDGVDGDLSLVGKFPDSDSESELDKLQALFDSLTVIFNAKRAATDKNISPADSAAFNTIKIAYDNSTDAEKKLNDTKNTVDESADLRKETEDLRDQVQPENTRDLNKLNTSMASQPDLTPVAKKVCGSVRAEPCTPLQCGGADLCPPEGAPPCSTTSACEGALPLGRRAEADVGDVKARLDRLTGKITDASEMLEKTQETAKQVTQSAEKLSSKMKKAKKEIEDDLKDTQDVVKALKDFLSDPSSNLTQIQEVSDWILKAKLPLNLDALKKKLEELKNLAANLPNSTAVLKEAEPQLEEAQKLLRKAKAERDAALGVKEEVDELSDQFRAGEESLSDLEEKLQESLDLVETLNKNLTEAENQLRPTEAALEEVKALVDPLKPQLDELKELLEKGSRQAQKAQEDAEAAEDVNDAAETDLSTLEGQLDELKNRTTPEADPVEERLLKLQRDAGNLVNTTEDMMTSLEGKADSLRRLQDQILQKSQNLQGLDTRLKVLLEELRLKARVLSNCQG